MQFRQCHKILRLRKERCQVLEDITQLDFSSSFCLCEHIQPVINWRFYSFFFVILQFLPIVLLFSFVNMFRNFCQLKLWFIYSFTKTVLHFQLVSYFTNFAVKKVNKELTSTLIYFVILVYVFFTFSHLVLQQNIFKLTFLVTNCVYFFGIILLFFEHNNRGFITFC
jgi:hypothetical protein